MPRRPIRPEFSLTGRILACVLVAGFMVLILADVILAVADGVSGVMVGVALWGVHMGLTQGLMAILIAEAAPAENRGSAFGLFNLVSGLTLFVSSLLAGLLWDHFGPSATFMAGAGFTAGAFIGVMLHWTMTSTEIIGPIKKKL